MCGCDESKGVLETSLHILEFHNSNAQQVDLIEQIPKTMEGLLSFLPYVLLILIIAALWSLRSAKKRDGDSDVLDTEDYEFMIDFLKRVKPGISEEWASTPKTKENALDAQKFSNLKNDLCQSLNVLKDRLNRLLDGEFTAEEQENLHSALMKIFGRNYERTFTKTELVSMISDHYSSREQKGPKSWKQLKADDIKKLAESLGISIIKQSGVAYEGPSVAQLEVESLRDGAFSSIIRSSEKTSKKHGTRVEVLTIGLIQMIFIDEHPDRDFVLSKGESPDLPDIGIDIKTSTKDTGVTSSSSSKSGSVLNAYLQRFLGLTHDVLLVRFEANRCDTIRFYNGSQLIDRKAAKRLIDLMIICNYKPRTISSMETQDFLRDMAAFLALTRENKETEFHYSVIDSFIESGGGKDPELIQVILNHKTKEAVKISSWEDLHNQIKPILFGQIRVQQRMLDEFHKRWSTDSFRTMNNSYLTTKGFELHVTYDLNNFEPEEE